MYDAAEDGAVDLAMFAEDESPEHEAEVGVADAGLFLGRAFPDPVVGVIAPGFEELESAKALVEVMGVAVLLGLRILAFGRVVLNFVFRLRLELRLRSCGRCWLFGLLWETSS